MPSRRVPEDGWAESPRRMRQLRTGSAATCALSTSADRRGLRHAILKLPAGFGRFESFAGTFASTAEFDRINPLVPNDRVWAGYGSTAAVAVDDDMAADAILRLSRGETLPPWYWLTSTPRSTRC